jgi:8-amino-7-oxononanoate synthase
VDIQGRWEEVLGNLSSANRYRRLASRQGVDFSSNDYLGFGKDAAEGQHVNGQEFRALSRSGQASRLVRGHHAVWDDVERSLAEWHGAEASLMFTSGYVANEGLLSTVIEPDDFVVSDELNHASIVDGLRLSKAPRLIFRHNDLAHLESYLRLADQTRQAGREVFAVTESLFSMDGDRAPLTDIAELCKRYRAHLIVDEAHATGCFGQNGSGLVDDTGLRQRVMASMHTGGKALAVTGAYVCGSKPLRELLINRCRHFIYTTALPPAIGGWWLEALERVKAASERRRRLHEGAARFRQDLEKHGVQSLGEDYIVPVIVGSDGQAVAAAQRLQAEGWDVRAIRPPSVPAGTARLRISIHADHDGAMLTELARAVADAVRPALAGVP